MTWGDYRNDFRAKEYTGRDKWHIQARAEDRIRKLPGLPYDENSPEFYEVVREYRKEALHLLRRWRLGPNQPKKDRIGTITGVFEYIVELANEILECDPPSRCRHIANRMLKIGYTGWEKYDPYS